MNKSLFLLPVCALFTLLSSSPGRSQEPPAAPLTIAVLPFEASTEKLQGKAAEAATLLAAHLSANPNLWMVERADIEKILGEQTIKLSGLTDPAQSVQAGKILGAKALVTGRLIQSGDVVVLVAKIMSTETSRVFGETASAAESASLEKPASELAEKIGKLMSKQVAVFQIPVERREDRVERLRKLVTGKPLPSVQILVSERELHANTVDPAVDTEMGKTFIELGFEVVSGNEGGKLADVVISGAAFSEAGPRRGQLVSSRARVEIKAVRRADSKVLAVDRETAVAVDITPGTAGKTALQQGAMTLLERLVPKLVL
jgi:hypothetical protein